ncbi:hypothetical protein GCM10009545_12540 [Saccharopolyspora thermophila]|uniref:Uncharacterized protein n=1 Tax=Saccharopolyspora thermophila TaxID=89367 RepID=A0ABN1C565_9PSEU
MGRIAAATADSSAFLMVRIEYPLARRNAPLFPPAPAGAHFFPGCAQFMESGGGAAVSDWVERKCGPQPFGR